MPEDIHELTVDGAGERRDKFIASRLPEISRSYIRKLIDDGSVSINGCIEKAGFKTAAGDKITVSVPQVETTGLKPEAIPLNIVYEDNDVIVIDKPAGLTVHPAPGHAEHTMVNAVLSHFPGCPMETETV
jgi:23S rRNA pseudouridine1911/1915/1917 synthase